MKRGDVVLVVGPGDIGKPRPGVIVQADERRVIGSLETEHIDMVNSALLVVFGLTRRR